MMSMNKPVIATNYSAHTEFCDKNNCYLIEVNEKDSAGQGDAKARDNDPVDQGFHANVA